MEKIPFARKGSRQLSEFIAQELLYDYATHQLDPDREEAVRLAINQNPSLAKQLEDILYGITYCRHLSQTTVSPSLLQKMKQPFSLWQNIEKALNIRTWNPGIQWMGESIVVSVSLLLISFFIPWESLVFNFIAQNNDQIVLSTLTKKNQDNIPLAQDSGRQLAQAIDSQEFKPEILRKYILRVANPQFTYNKMPTLLSKFGATITDQVLVAIGKDTIPQVTFSLPQDRAEALIKELETNGKLTLSRSTGENEKEKEIWTFQIELEKEVK